MSEIECNVAIDEKVEDAWMINLEEEYLTAERKALQLINVLKRKATLIKRESASVMTVNVDEVNAKEALRKLEKMSFFYKKRRASCRFS